ncbi:MAG: hypothetical protein RQ743_12555 [Bacteroidales bacterium]|nr:hypothetical protein [Bacteroidales bacterium]MDT8402518.1 hypothetical protein [Bacteroidales bacterium]
MKAILKIFFWMAAFSLVAGCDKTDEFIPDEDFQLKSVQLHEVTVPFEVNLLGQITNVDLEATECTDEGYYCRVIVESTGTATHMGKVSLTFNFCTYGPDDPDVPGEDNKYAGSSAVLVAANGDELFLYLEGGTVIVGRTDDHPDYVVDYWRDPIEILGGTGRFEGASGTLQMDDFTTNIDTYTHHQWTGEITLVKGKK